jgi:hypothetical protein
MHLYTLSPLIVKLREIVSSRVRRQKNHISDLPLVKSVTSFLLSSGLIEGPKASNFRG